MVTSLHRTQHSTGGMQQGTRQLGRTAEQHTWTCSMVKQSRYCWTYSATRQFQQLQGMDVCTP
jgi:hypothetical protein